MTDSDLIKIVLLARYAEHCGMYLFDSGYGGKSQSLRKKLKMF